MSDPIDAAIEAAQPHLVPALDITLPDGRVARLPYPLSVVRRHRRKATARSGAILTPAGPRLVR